MFPSSDLPSDEELMDTSEAESNQIHSDVEMTDRNEPPIQSPLGLIAVLFVMMQYQKTECDRLKSENERLREELEWSREETTRAACPLLSLPNELIGHIFSFLHIKDRMRARLCKRLDEVEKAYNYYVPRCLIHSRRTDDPNRMNTWITDHKQYFVLLHEKVHSTDFLKRILQNANFGYVDVAMSFPGEFNREVYSLIKDGSFEELTVRPGYRSMDNEIITDSYLFDIMNQCYKLRLQRSASITVDGLHMVYQAMVERSAKLKSIDLGYTPTVMQHSFLRLIGIKYEKGTLYSNRDIEVYDFTDVLEACEEDEEDVFLLYKHIFDGNLEIVIHHYEEDPEGTMRMVYHETKEELDKAKNGKGFIRFEVLPEEQ